MSFETPRDQSIALDDLRSPAMDAKETRATSLGFACKGTLQKLASMRFPIKPAQKKVPSQKPERRRTQKGGKQKKTVSPACSDPFSFTLWAGRTHRIHSLRAKDSNRVIGLDENPNERAAVGQLNGTH